MCIYFFLSLLGNRMFTFDDQSVDFYLPQLVSLYVHHSDVAEAIHPYLVYRYDSYIIKSYECIFLSALYIYMCVCEGEREYAITVLKDLFHKNLSSLRDPLHIFFIFKLDSSQIFHLKDGLFII